MASKIFEELQNNISPENRQFVDKNLAISRQVRHILAHHETIKTQKDLAVALNKEPSEISRWLSGLHNIGLENITKMETVLGVDIILTDEQAKEKYGKSSDSRYKVYQRVHFSGKSENIIVDTNFYTHIATTMLPVRSGSKRKGPEDDRFKIAY